VPAVRYQRERPSELVHLDTRNRRRIDGIDHRITGRSRLGKVNARFAIAR
jgi:hypothetical protein